MVLPEAESYCSSSLLLHHWLYCFYDRNVMVMIKKKKKKDQSCLNHLTSRGAEVMSPGLRKG